MNAKPCILASSDESINVFKLDVAFIGGKASGLLSLPSEWVPPFLVLTKSFFELWLTYSDARKALLKMGKADQQRIIDFLKFVKDNYSTSGSNATPMLVRSNAPVEDSVALHGAYDSYVVSAEMPDVASAIDQIMRSAQPTSMCVLLQGSVSPCLSGHMSNERRVSANQDEWLVEGLHEGESLRVQAKKPKLIEPLMAKTETEFLRKLALVAGVINKNNKSRFHCEWVWSGKQVWIVQRDSADHNKSDTFASRYIRSVSASTDDFTPSETSGLVHFQDVAEGKWKKLRRPFEFRRLGLPTADIYVLPGDLWLAGSKDGHTALREDLSRMCRHPVVVRCDIASDVLEMGEDLLPTSEPSTDPNDLLNFMATAARNFKSKGLSEGSWAFNPAHWIPARASAFVRAFPQGQRMRIDALWGFPDGLSYFPHDTYFYSPGNGGIEQQVRYKEYCRLYREGEWRSCVVAPPYDWETVLSQEEISTISSWASKVANSLNQEIQLMVMARIGGLRGQDACLPFHFTTEKSVDYDHHLKALPLSAIIIRTPADIERLIHSSCGVPLFMYH